MLSEKFIDKDGNEFKLTAYVVKKIKDKYVFHGILDNGKELPVSDLHSNFKRSDKYYIKQG